MIVNIELENAEDFAFIKELLEKIKGVKSVSVKEDEVNRYEITEGLPVNVFEKIEKYGESLKSEDLISKEDFFKFIDDEICRLNSPK